MATGGKHKSFPNHSREADITKDIEFQFFKFKDNDTYRPWWTGKRIFRWLHVIPEDNLWNCFMCLIALLAIVWSACNFNHFYVYCMDIVYNVAYGVHVLAVGCSMLFTTEYVHTSYITWVRFSVDMISYANLFGSNDWKLIFYYLRLHRPLQFLWDLTRHNLEGSVVGTALKYCYIFSILRVTLALIWLYVEKFESQHNIQGYYHSIYKLEQASPENVTGSDAIEFLKVFYAVNKKFLPIGPSVAPWSDFKRIACLLVMIIGCLVVTGAAVASLSIVISLYMTPEEAFRARYKLIMKEMNESHVPLSLREKVETFYRMYWHKQRAVSDTQLLPTYPPTLPAMIYYDIYFQAMQKSRILSDLTYEFLSEVAKKMITVHYIPGDPIIKRLSKKSSIIYITYGDIEMLTAEDDSTAILRMTRGTVLAPCAGCVAAGCDRAHVQIRAATFCTAHVLDAGDLWRVALKYGRRTNQNELLLTAFYEHFEKVKKHYYERIPDEVRYKSSILHFKRNLMALKEARDSRGNLLLGNPEIFLEIAGCYIMRNTSDATSTDEADAICLRSTFPCILQPDSSLQAAWKTFVSCVIIAVCTVHPYYLIYKKDVPAEFRCFDYVVTAIYGIDLVVHLSTAANVEEGVPITFTQTSSQQMRSCWFVLDVLSTVPIFEFIGNGHFAGINKLLRLPKVFYMLKSLEDVCVYHSTVLRFMSYSLFLLIACYLIAAMQQGFMCFKLHHCLVKNFTHSPFWKEEPLDEDTIKDRLTFGLYWAVSMFTFTSHMEMTGLKKWDNLLYTIFMLEICIVLRIFVEAVYSATIMVTTLQRESYDASIANVKNFLIKNDVNPLLMQRFITYLQLCWYTDKAYSMTHKKESIFHDLPPHVYQDIVARQRSQHILNIPFMKLLHKKDLKYISSSARLFYTSPNEILLNTGDITNEIYIIKQGICEILNPLTKRVVGTLAVRSHFGVLECLLRLPAFYTVRAVTHVQIVSVSKKILAPALDVPQIQFAIKFCKEQPEYARLQHRHESFVWYKLPEPAPNTERFRMPRKFEYDDEFLRPFNRLGYLSVLRYIFPRFTIRPDGRYLLRYEWLRAVCALSSAMFFPSYTYLVLQWPSLTFITLILDMSAYYDIIQRMLVGYFNELGILVYHPYGTATHYLKGAFFVDLFACLPLEYLESPLRESFENYYKLAQVRQLLMMNRLIQLYRIPSAILSLTGYIERRDIQLVIHAIPLFMALLNVLTSLVVFYSVDIFISMDQTSYRIVPFNDKGGSWINLFHKVFRFNMTETPWNLHLGCYFWVVYETTTTGYNCFNPTNFELMQVLFVGMVIGAMITTYFSVRIISIRANVNKPLAAYQEHMKDLAVYMQRENLDRKLRQEVINYYEFNWDKMGGVDYTKVLKLCNQITMRTDAILHIYGPTFAKCPFLVNCDVSLLRIVGRALQSLYVLSGMAIVEDHDVIGDLYFVDYGAVEARATVGDKCTTCRLLRGSVFGNLDAETTISSSMAFVATCRTHLLKIKSTTFHQILADFPATQQLMRNYRSEQHYIPGSIDDPVRLNEKRQTYRLALQVRRRRRLVEYLYFKDQFIQMYLTVVSLLCIYADVYNAGFQNNSLVLIITLYALDIAFAMKLLLQYLIPCIVDSHPKEILLPLRKSYVKGDFKYDVISCLPLELLCFLANDKKGMVFSCLRLNRFLRLVTVYTGLKRHNQRLTINLTLTTVSTVVVWFTMFIHTATCIWYFIGALEEDARPKSSWLYNDAGQSWCHNHYVCSMYFVLTTFTQNGVGDIMPRKQSEVVFVCLLQVLSTLVYMVYVGEFSNIIQYKVFRAFSFYIKCLELQEFMRNNRVSRNLVGLVNRYSLHLWRESRGLQVPYFLSSAPPCIKLRIMSAAYLLHLAKVYSLVYSLVYSHGDCYMGEHDASATFTIDITHPLFENCETAFLRQLVGHFQLYNYNKGMYVVKEKEITGSMYIIHTGKVLEFTDKGGCSTVYNAGQYFGEMEGIFQNAPFTYSYKTLMKSQVLTLHFQDWEYLLKHFPKSKETIYRRFDDNPDSSKPDDSMGGMPGVAPLLAPLGIHPPGPNSTSLMRDHSPPPVPSYTELRDGLPTDTRQIASSTSADSTAADTVTELLAETAAVSPIETVARTERIVRTPPEPLAKAPTDIVAEIRSETTQTITEIPRLTAKETVAEPTKTTAKAASDAEISLSIGISQIENVFTSTVPTAETATKAEDALQSASEIRLQSREGSTMQMVTNMTTNRRAISSTTPNSETLGSKASDESIGPVQTPKIKDLLEKIKSKLRLDKNKAISNTASILSTLSEKETLLDTTNIANAMKSSNTFIDKTKGVMPKRISISSTLSSDKDVMIREVEEAATRELKNIKKNSNELAGNDTSTENVHTILSRDKRNLAAKTASQGTINTQQISQSMDLEIVIDDDDFPETLSKNTKESHPDKKDEATTSTPRLTGRYVHVRYEDDKFDSSDEQPNNSKS